LKEKRNMYKITIDPGICSFPIIVKAESDDMQHVKLHISTGCSSIQQAAKELKEVDAYKEIFVKPDQSTTYQVLSKYVPHPSCPVYTGILKAVEVAAGLALPKDATIKVEKMD
jgi:hypothetical protein